jgi:hypothetical protein
MWDDVTVTGGDSVTIGGSGCVSVRYALDVRRFVVVINCALPMSSEVAAATTRGWVNAPLPLLDHV